MVRLRSYIKFALGAVLCTGGVVLADWDVGDPALYYQLPDPAGWSVYSEWGTGTVETEGFGAGAADWTAEVTAPITDIHFWGGWKYDVVGETTEILVQIFNNDTTTSGFPQPGDECLWSRTINHDEYTRRLYNNTGDHGWYDPRYTDHWQANNQDLIFQYSISVISNPFIQQAGQTYWLMISMNVEGSTWGWNSAQSVSGSSAVFWDKNSSSGWTELMTPAGYQDPRTLLDLAFVIATPEPTTLLLLTLGGLALRSEVPEGGEENVKSSIDSRKSQIGNLPFQRGIFHCDYAREIAGCDFIRIPEVFISRVKVSG